MNETQTYDAGHGNAETITPPPLKISSNEWPMTHFHERASIAPNDETERERETENSPVTERLNKPLPGRINDLRAEHRFLDELVKGRHGKISRVIYDLAAARHRLVRDAINAIENPFKTERIAANEHAAQMIGHTKRPANRQAEISNLEFALKQLETDQGYIARMDIFISEKASPAIKFLIGEDDIIIGIGWLRQALAEYRLAVLKNWGLMFPEERLREIHSEHQRGVTDADTVRALNAEAASLTLVTAKETARAMRAAMIDLWKSTVEQPLQFLVNVSVKNLEKIKEFYVDRDKAAFKLHPLGLEYKPSPLSTSFDPWIEQFKGLLQAKQPSIALPELGGTPHTGEDTVLQSVFMLPILAD